MTDPRTGVDELRERLRAALLRSLGYRRVVYIGGKTYRHVVDVGAENYGRWLDSRVDDVLACLDAHSPQDSRQTALKHIAQAREICLPYLHPGSAAHADASDHFSLAMKAIRATPVSEPSGDVPAEHAWTVADTAPLRFVKDHAAGMDVPPFYMHCQHCGVSRTASEYFRWRRCSKAPRLTLRPAAPVPATGWR